MACSAWFSRRLAAEKICRLLRFLSSVLVTHVTLTALHAGEAVFASPFYSKRPHFDVMLNS